jgi:hypothetical protein
LDQYQCNGRRWPQQRHIVSGRLPFKVGREEEGANRRDGDGGLQRDEQSPDTR